LWCLSCLFLVVFQRIGSCFQTKKPCHVASCFIQTVAMLHQFHPYFHPYMSTIPSGKLT
jgi:hypothetical protein